MSTLVGSNSWSLLVLVVCMLAVTIEHKRCHCRNSSETRAFKPAPEISSDDLKFSTYNYGRIGDKNLPPKYMDTQLWLSFKRSRRVEATTEIELDWERTLYLHSFLLAGMLHIRNGSHFIIGKPDVNWFETDLVLDYYEKFRKQTREAVSSYGRDMKYRQAYVYLNGLSFTIAAKRPSTWMFGRKYWDKTWKEMVAIGKNSTANG